MNCTKRITITGYKVCYTDLREPRPRNIREEVYIVDKEYGAALALLGLDVADMIAARYERGGFHVVGVERLQGRTVTLNLSQLWEAAADGTGANLQSIGNLEANNHD